MLSEKSDSRIFLNKGADHALIVLERIFKQSSDTVRIFAGNLCLTVGNKPEYILALSDFIERGGKVRIMLNDYNEDLAKDSNLYMRLAYYKSKGSDIIIKKTTAKPYLESDPDQKEVHFTVGDNKAYRMETDIKQRAAQCSMNRPETAAMAAEFFDGLFNGSESTEIDILSMFGYNE
jgi:hypothetical protein